MQFMNMVMDIADRLDTSRLAMAEAGLGVVVLGSVYASQYLGGLQPCVLCLYQRWPWWVATGLAMLAIVLRRHLRMQALTVGLASLSILIGACIAAFHVGVERHWWQGLASCVSVSDMPLTVEALKAQIMSAPVARCEVHPRSSAVAAHLRTTRSTPRARERRARAEHLDAGPCHACRCSSLTS